MGALTVHISIAGIGFVGVKDERNQYFILSESGTAIAVDDYTDYLKWMADVQDNVVAKFMLLALCKGSIKSLIDNVLSDKGYSLMVEKSGANEREAIKTCLEDYFENKEH